MPDGVDKAEYAGRLKHGLGTLRIVFFRNLEELHGLGELEISMKPKVFYLPDFFGVTKVVFLS